MMPVNSRAHYATPWIAALLLLSIVVGCAKSPTTYTAPPDDIEAFRSTIHRVALVGGQYKAIPHMDLPAKGLLAAAGRGFISGVGLTVAAGAVSPIPGGTLLGIVLSPIGGLVGTFHGMANAEPPEKVEAVEEALTKAVSRLVAMNLGDTFRDELLKKGEEQTDLQFTFIDKLGPTSVNDYPTYTQTEVGDADVVLEIRPLRAGLRGLWSVNPPSSPFSEVGVRLIRVSDNAVLVNDILMCAGEERTYDQWAENDGQLFVDEIIQCVPRLAEKVLDDVFRTYALSRRR